MKQCDKQGEIWASQSYDKVAEYWEYPNFKRRAAWLAKQLKPFAFDNIFEVGFFSGRNLKIIKDIFPDVDIGGIDINSNAILFAQEKLPDARLSVSSVYDMDTSTKWDIVFTAGVMIHIPPDGIEQSIDKCIDKANKYVVHMETMGKDVIMNGPVELNPKNKIKNKMHWWPDLAARYASRGKEVLVNIDVPYYRKDHPFKLIIVKL